jgi:purine-binding chemotaxis protein CheW
MANLAVKKNRLAIARRALATDRGPHTKYLSFVLANDVYAAPVALIREILPPWRLTLTPVPRAPPTVLGIVSVRGELVTVIDLRRRLRLHEAPFSRRARILLSDARFGERLGLYVDEVLQVYRLADQEIEPAATALGGEIAPYIAGIARLAGKRREARRMPRGGRTRRW